MEKILENLKSLTMNQLLEHHRGLQELKEDPSLEDDAIRTLAANCDITYDQAKKSWSLTLETTIGLVEQAINARSN